MRLPFVRRDRNARAKTGFARMLLLIGMGMMIPCYLFTVANVALSPWPLYELSLIHIFKALARHIAPSNDEDGVMRVIRERFHIKLFHGQEENA